MYHKATIHGSGNQKVDVGLVPLSITLDNPLTDFSIPTLFCCVDFEILVPKGRLLLPGDKKWVHSMDDETTSWTLWAQVIQPT